MFAQSKLFRNSGAKLGCGTLALFSLLFSGCADSIFWGGESNLGTTETGVAAGAAIGAGLGAFIGSTAGGVGEGLVIGALAGGVTGGLVGREIELEEGVKSERTESVRQSNDMMREQRREQNQIRRNSSDVSRGSYAAPRQEQFVEESSSRSRAQMGREFDFTNSGSSGHSKTRKETVRYGKKTYLNPPSRANSAARSFDGSDTYGRDTVLARSSGAQSAPRTAEPRVATKPEKFETKSDLEQLKPPAPKEVASLPAENLSTGGKAEIDLDLGKPEALPPARSVTAVSEKTEKPTQAKVAANTQPSTEQCIEAQEEASRAQTASSDADKLFYLTRAIRLCPQSSDYHTQVGKVYAKIGRQQDAEFEFRQAVDLDSENTEAAEFLGKKKSTHAQGKAAVAEETASLETEEGGELPEGEL